MGTQKNRLTETILLSTHNIGFGCRIKILEHEKRSLSGALHATTGASVADESFNIVEKAEMPLNEPFMFFPMFSTLYQNDIASFRYIITSFF